jgi:hypothetical protein
MGKLKIGNLIESENQKIGKVTIRNCYMELVPPKSWKSEFKCEKNLKNQF